MHLLGVQVRVEAQRAAAAGADREQVVVPR